MEGSKTPASPSGPRPATRSGQSSGTPERRVSPVSPIGTPPGTGFIKSPRSVAGTSAAAPISSVNGVVIPFDHFGEVARLSRTVRGQGDVVTEDALLAGWLMVKEGVDWFPRFFQLRSGTLSSFGCRSGRNFVCGAKTSVKFGTVAAADQKWLRPEFVSTVTVMDPSFAKPGFPTLLCTAVQAKMFKVLDAASTPANQEAAVRLIICFRVESGKGPVACLVRVGMKGSVHVFDLEEATEYTLMGLKLEATDEAASADFPFGLLISSAISDQMFVPLENLLVAAPTPLNVLQWMGALKNADLDPPPAEVTATPPRNGVGLTGARQQRSQSGALLGQLVSNAVGNTKGSFSGLGEMPSSNERQKEDLDALMKAVSWDASKPVSLREALTQPVYQKALSAFCKTIFTEENVNFVVAVAHFKETRDPRAKHAAAHSIVAEYISYSGKSVVNVSASTRKRVEDVMASGVPVPPNVFDQALEDVMALIEEDSWPKFVTALTERQEESAIDDVEHSWDSGDSSSYEEREQSAKGGKGKSQRSAQVNDFGDSSMSQVDIESIHKHVIENFECQNNEIPPLKILLAKKATRELLKEFARTILAEENVNFWETVQRFKFSDDVVERKKFLKTLFEDFIPADGKTMVNIAGSERSHLMKLYQEKGLQLSEMKDVFDVSLVELEKVMELDLYPKFVRLIQESGGSKGRKNVPKPKVLPLWEMLNDADQVNALLLFATVNNQQDDILFWCLVQRYRVEVEAEMRGKLGSYIMGNYVSNSAPRMIRVDKAKKAACCERFSSLSHAKANLPIDLFDALWKDVQSSMNKHLHPQYEKFVKKGHVKQSTLRGSSNLLAKELVEAFRDEESTPPPSQKWVPVKATESAVTRTASSSSVAPSNWSIKGSESVHRAGSNGSITPPPGKEEGVAKKGLLGGTRRKADPK